MLYSGEPVPAAVVSPTYTGSLPRLMNVPTKDRPEREEKRPMQGVNGVVRAALLYYLYFPSAELGNFFLHVTRGLNCPAISAIIFPT